MEENNDKPRTTDLFRDGATKHKFRQPLYETAIELHEKIHDYLKWEEVCTKGKFTVEGCSLYLGYSSTKTLRSFVNQDNEFAYVVQRFYLFMEHYHAQKLQWVGTYQGSAFWLKNFAGWRDESTQHQNVTTIKADFGSSTVHTPS